MRLVFLTLFLLVAGSFAQRNQDLAFRVNQYAKNTYGFQAFNDDRTNILNFVKGFLNGVGEASIFDNIKACIQDDQIIVQDIITGIEDIQTKVASKVQEGIALIGKAVEIIPTAVQQCKVAAADVKTLIKMVESFKNPTSFLYYVGKSILINRVDVFKEVSSAVKAYQSGDFTNFGYWIGRAMDTIFIGQKAIQDTQTDVLNFAKGFLAGVASENIFDDIKACITDTDTIVKDVVTGIADIKTKNPAKVKEGIALLGEAAQIVPQAAQLCRASASEIQKFINFAKTFTSPEAFLYYIGKSLLINHVEIIKEVNQAVAAFEAKNYYDLGYWVGKAMDSIIIGEDQVISQAFVDHLNGLGQWKAAVPKKFEGMTYAQIKKQFLGANLIDTSVYKNLTVFNYEGVKDVPAYFNSSEQWPGCVHPIRDQGHCGSCWAFAASEVLSDRFCIASNGSVNVVLSPQYLLSCNNVMNHGCNGGVPLFSWWFLVSDGLLTDSCLPYASYNGTQPIKCKDVTKCADGSALKNYHASKGSVVQLPNPASIQANILQYGPVETGFTVYQDFMSYAGGIYTHQSGSALGGHAVKIIGWGNENGTNYWIVANSWGPSWGENGFFRIAFGQCGIDSGVVAGQADVSKLSQTKIPTHWW